MILIAVSLAALSASAFFSGTETGLLSVSRERILHLVRKGGRRAKMIQQALADMECTTATILIGNNIANVTYSTASTAVILALIPNHAAQSTACFVAAGLVLYFGEFMPKLLFSTRPLRRTLLIAPVFRTISAVLFPLTLLAMKLTDALMPQHRTEQKTTAAEIMRILRDRQDGVCLSDFEHTLITHLVSLRMKGQPVTRESIYAAINTASTNTPQNRLPKT